MTKSRISPALNVRVEPLARAPRWSLAFLVLALCGGIVAGSTPTSVPVAKPATALIDDAQSWRGGHASVQPRLTAVAVKAERPGASTDDRIVRALADIVAKRYRVATDATRELVAIAYQEARRNRLDPLLVLAVIAVESRFNPIAESGGGALGLMQIVPKYHVQTVNETTRASMLDPQHNIGLGARVLKQYVKAGGTEIAGLQLYNGTADDATNAYANRVMAEKQGLEDLLRRARDRA